MSIILGLGFEHCSTSGSVLSLANYVENTDAWVPVTGFNGTTSLRATSSNCIYRVLVPVADYSKTMVIGLHTCHPSKSSLTYDDRLFSFYGPDIRLIHYNGHIYIYRGTTYMTVINDVFDGSWHHVEAKLFSDASAGTLDIKVDGVTIYSGTGLNTNGATISGCEFRLSYPGTYVYYDNLFFATDWVGELHFVGKAPNADFDCDFSPVSGSDNYAMIDEKTDNDGDTTYNQSSSVGAIDLFDYEDISDVDIQVVIIRTICKKSDIGTRILRHKFQQESSLYDGEQATLSSNYGGTSYGAPANLREVLNLAPDGTSPWSSTVFNNLKIGYEIIT